MAGECQVLEVVMGHSGPAAKVFKWTNLAANSCGIRVAVAPWTDRSVQVSGTFGGAVTLRGSNKADPAENTAADWFPLVDPQGNAISFTSAGGEAVLEATYWVSPLAAAAVTGVDVHLFVGSQR